MTMMRWFLTSILALGVAGSAPADTLPDPQGQVVLTVSGAISNTNGDGIAEFDMAMLDAMQQRETLTETPWFDGEQTFTGPLLSDIMQVVGAEGSEIRVTAINDFAASMPWSDLADFPTILASRNNGALMSVRDKGPLFVIYPFEEHEELRDEVHFSRSVWQVVSIEVLP